MIFLIRVHRRATVDEDPPTRTMLAARALAERDRHPDLWGQRELHYDREYHRALADLTHLQKRNAQRTHLSSLLSTPPSPKEPPSNPPKTPSKPQFKAVEATIEADEPTNEGHF